MDDEKRFLSSKAIPPEERLIVALDVASHEEAYAWVDRLGDRVRFYKLGLELFLAGDYRRMIDGLVKRGKHVFADLKLFDVPETVRSAVCQLAESGACFATVHGNEPMIEAASSAKGPLRVLAVTVLTSLDETDVKDLGFDCNVSSLVLSRARRALARGADGVVSSGLEARELREELGAGFLVVTPGIRPLENRTMDDQKRVMSPREAFLNGADYVVVGRPIREAPDPAGAALGIQETIRELFGARGGAA